MMDTAVSVLSTKRNTPPVLKRMQGLFFRFNWVKDAHAF